MEDNHLEEALIAIRRVMRATEINSLSLAKKSQLTPTQQAYEHPRGRHGNVVQFLEV